MNEIELIISKIPDGSRNELIEHLKNSIHSYNPQLHIHIDISEPFLWLTTKRGYFKLYYSQCSFIETDRRNLIFHCENRILRKTGKISSILEKLPDSIFFRCNNSYIVNLHYISHIVPEGDRYDLRLCSGETIPLSRSRYQNCLKALHILSRS